MDIWIRKEDKTDLNTYHRKRTIKKIHKWKEQRNRKINIKHQQYLEHRIDRIKWKFGGVEGGK